MEQLNREPNSPNTQVQAVLDFQRILYREKCEKNVQPGFIYYWIVISKLQHVNLAKVHLLIFIHGLVIERFKQYLNKGVKISLKGGNEKWQVNKNLK